MSARDEIRDWLHTKLKPDGDGYILVGSAADDIERALRAIAIYCDWHSRGGQYGEGDPPCEECMRRGIEAMKAGSQPTIEETIEMHYCECGKVLRPEPAAQHVEETGHTINQVRHLPKGGLPHRDSGTDPWDGMQRTGWHP